MLGAVERGRHHRRNQSAAASAALDRFMGLKRRLSRCRVATAMSAHWRCRWAKKRMLTAACEDSLRALQEALAKRGFSATR